MQSNLVFKKKTDDSDISSWKLIEQQHHVAKEP
jgi:hypothetical protein